MKGDSPYLFPNAWDKSRPMDPTGFKKPWAKLRTDNGIEGRFHDIRHSYCTRIFANPDVNPVLVCKAIGMSMRVAMSVYIHFDEKHLTKVTSAFDLGEE
jgi:integrase